MLCSALCPPFALSLSLLIRFRFFWLCPLIADQMGGAMGCIAGMF